MMEPRRAEEQPESILQQEQIEQVRLTNEKLRLEVAELRKAKRSHPILAQLVPIVTTLVAVAGFLWAVAQYVEEQRKARDAAAEDKRKAQVTAEREFMKPWLESQREIYLQALSFAATAANSENSINRQRATAGFWQLYQGKMILVETTTVSGAMKQFGHCLEPPGAGRHKKSPACSTDEMNTRLRSLATAMAESMAKTANMTFDQFSSNQFKY